MSGMQNPPSDWGGPTDWQKQPGPGQPPYGGSAQPPPPGAPPPYGNPQAWPGAAAPAIQTYLVPAILVTLFCFLPTGIAAIVFASQVNSKRSVGDYAGAMHASKQARLWTIISLVVGLVFIAFFIIITAAAGGGSSSGY
jgi:Interferon-induced transmembrane protein